MENPSVPRGSQAAYMQEYRQRRPDALLNQRRAAKERKRALDTLVRRHPQEFEAILQEIRRNR
jgi:hypothetical protein